MVTEALLTSLMCKGRMSNPKYGPQKLVSRFSALATLPYPHPMSSTES